MTTGAKWPAGVRSSRLAAVQPAPPPTQALYAFAIDMTHTHTYTHIGHNNIGGTPVSTATASNRSEQH